jgi:uncharacterized protein (DUF1810 family)
MAHAYDLQRFVDAQAGSYDHALDELRRGRKTSHWMWFVFPQIVGLGSSPMAQRYAIGSLEEAQAYLAHPLLGDRLRACVAATLPHAARGSRPLFGSPDDVKFRSSLTLFALAAPQELVFQQALETFYDGQFDPRTLEILRQEMRESRHS